VYEAKLVFARGRSKDVWILARIQNLRISLYRVIFTLLLALLLIQCGRSDAPVTMADQAPNARRAPVAPDLPPPEGIIVNGATWEPLASGYIYTDGPAADSEGNVFFADVVANRLLQINSAGEVTAIDEATAMTLGLVIGPNGFLYGCRNRDAQIVRYSKEGEIEVLLQGELSPLANKPDQPGEFCNDLAINSAGGIWFTDRINRRVMYLNSDGVVKVATEGFRPNGIALSADRRIIAVTDSVVPLLHAFSVGEDGELTELPDFFDPLMTVEQIGAAQVVAGRPGSNGMTVDNEGRFYVTTFYGIQVFDREGNYIGVIHSPKGFMSNLTFGGPGYGWLYVTGRQGIFRLDTQAHGIGW
jgi:gluconolactonase